jgi:hypothetical protein
MKSLRWQSVMGGNPTVSEEGGVKPSRRTYSRFGDKRKMLNNRNKEGKKAGVLEYSPRDKYVKL